MAARTRDGQVQPYTYTWRKEQLPDLRVVHAGLQQNVLITQHYYSVDATLSSYNME